jgi:hypothetical protein
MLEKEGSQSQSQDQDILRQESDTEAKPIENLEFEPE